jgi:hypothetical protein
MTIEVHTNGLCAAQAEHRRWAVRQPTSGPVTTLCAAAQTANLAAREFFCAK